ncbi:hypothetical protein [Streptomyces monashensis]|uniref:hypothetical protein n=1 Tax=Streptomyces monashensis TaxID=1678012 RepID=UPI0011604CEC|nr:hypothetical protein [Streptomyces monashensis]
MTGATPAPIVKALLSVLASGDAWDTDGSPITEESIVEVTRPLADVGWNPKTPGRYLRWRPEREIRWLPCSPRPTTPPPCRSVGSADPM